jgi:hypothetical protein
VVLAVLDAHDRLGAAAIRFPSRLDGNPCFAIFEDRGGLTQAGDAIALSDPAPSALVNVCAAWKLTMHPCPADQLAVLRS